MKRNAVLLTLAVCLILAMGPGVHAQDLDCKIRPGDMLHISVWKNADLTREVVVLPDGRIHFPLVKELTTAGESVEDRTTIVNFNYNEVSEGINLEQNILLKRSDVIVV